MLLQEIVDAYRADTGGRKKKLKPMVTLSLRRTQLDMPCQLLVSHCVNNCGYPVMFLNYRHTLVSRIVLAHNLGGVIPDGIEASHACEDGTTLSRMCVEPSHIVPETHKENMRRTIGKPNPRGRKRVHMEWNA